MPKALKELIETLSFLPGIGEKTAEKLALFLLQSHPTYLQKFSHNLDALQTETKECSICFSIMDATQEECSVCSDPHRSDEQICVVEDYLDLLRIESTGVFTGKYHVLGGSISPIRGVAPNDLHFSELFTRTQVGVTELIIATNPNFEGEATALYIKENLPNKDITLTRLSRGLSNSSDIEYADEITLMNAFKGRQDL